MIFSLNHEVLPSFDALEKDGRKTASCCSIKVLGKRNVIFSIEVLGKSNIKCNLKTEIQLIHSFRYSWLIQIQSLLQFSYWKTIPGAYIQCILYKHTLVDYFEKYWYLFLCINTDICFFQRNSLYLIFVCVAPTGRRFSQIMSSCCWHCAADGQFWGDRVWVSFYNHHLSNILI